VLRFHRFAAVPWFLPGVIVAIVLGYVARRRVARWFGASNAIAWGLVVALGLVLSATLTPHQDTPTSVATATAYGCDMSRLSLAPLDEVLAYNDVSLNIALFVPLGAIIGLLPRSRRKGVVIAAAVALPFVIETTQLLVAPLDRACQSADVIDNLTGIVLGLASGSLAGVLAGRRGRG
jgi:glycopeptide antibiotics resistance protein